MLVSFGISVFGYAVLDTDTGALSFSEVEIGLSAKDCNWCCDPLEMAYINGYFFCMCTCWKAENIDFRARIIKSLRIISAISDDIILAEYDVITRRGTTYNAIPPIIGVSYLDFKRKVLLC